MTIAFVNAPSAGLRAYRFPVMSTPRTGQGHEGPTEGRARPTSEHDRQLTSGFSGSWELSIHNGRHMSSAMRTRIVCLAAVALGLSLVADLSSSAIAATPRHHKHPAHAAAHSATTGPEAIGSFGNWIAATYEQGGHKVCYAFTRAQSSTPSLPHRGDVVLTVTQRPDLRDGVAIAAGFDYPANATVTVQVDRTGLQLYTAQRNAFARDGKAAVAAFRRGARAIARSPGPHGHRVTDTFSLKGFSAAYAADVKACPPPK